MRAIPRAHDGVMHLLKLKKFVRADLLILEDRDLAATTEQ